MSVYLTAQVKSGFVKKNPFEIIFIMFNLYDLAKGQKDQVIWFMFVNNLHFVSRKFQFIFKIL